MKKKKNKYLESIKRNCTDNLLLLRNDWLIVPNIETASHSEAIYIVHLGSFERVLLLELPTVTRISAVSCLWNNKNRARSFLFGALTSLIKRF